MLATIGLALTPTFLCAMVGMALLLCIDSSPNLTKTRSGRWLLLCVLISTFASLCAILLFLRIPLAATAVLAGSALLFLLPPLLRIALMTHQAEADESPFLWQVRSSIRRGSARNYQTRLEVIEKRLQTRSMDPILRLKALNLALAANENSRALYHAHLLDEILPLGSAHAEVLWKTIQIMALRQRRPADAIPALKRFEQLYPARLGQLRKKQWIVESEVPLPDEI